MRTSRTAFAIAMTGTTSVMTLLVACGEESVRPTFEVLDAAPFDAPAPVPTTDDAGAAQDADAPEAALAVPSVECDASPYVVRVVAGLTHYCAVLDDKSVRCWGSPSLLGVGGGDAIDAAAPGATPVKVEGVANVADIVTSADRTCVTLADGNVDCWGAQEPTPTRLPDLASIKQFSPAAAQSDGTQLSCAVTTSGTPQCWGDSFMIGLVPGTPDLDFEGLTATDLILAPPSPNWGFTAAGFLLDATGVLRSWGFDALLLGRPLPSGLDYIPGVVNALPPVRSVTTSALHACAASLDGRLFCWGAAGAAMLGVGYVRDEPYPVEVAFADRWPHQVSASASHTCTAMTSGAVYCWGGLNPMGERGTMQQKVTLVPLEVEGLTKDVVSVAAGLSSTCALLKSGAVWCWGANDSGQLGRGSRDSARHPVPAPVVFP